jgi:hypothetical protein
MPESVNVTYVTCGAVAQVSRDPLAAHKLLHADHTHALVDIIERKEVGEAVRLLVALALVQQVHGLIWREYQSPASGERKYQHELHLHADVVPAANVYKQNSNTGKERKLMLGSVACRLPGSKVTYFTFGPWFAYGLTYLRSASVVCFQKVSRSPSGHFN